VRLGTEAVCPLATADPSKARERSPRACVAWACLPRARACLLWFHLGPAHHQNELRPCLSFLLRRPSNRSPRADHRSAARSLSRARSLARAPARARSRRPSGPAHSVACRALLCLLARPGSIDACLHALEPGDCLPPSAPRACIFCLSRSVSSQFLLICFSLHRFFADFCVTDH
jgi:hypothetical protein